MKNYFSLVCKQRSHNLIELTVSISSIVQNILICLSLLNFSSTYFFHRADCGRHLLRHVRNDHGRGVVQLTVRQSQLHPEPLHPRVLHILRTGRFTNDIIQYINLKV